MQPTDPRPACPACGGVHPFGCATCEGSGKDPEPEPRRQREAPPLDDACTVTKSGLCLTHRTEHAKEAQPASPAPLRWLDLTVRIHDAVSPYLYPDPERREIVMAAIEGVVEAACDPDAGPRCDYSCHRCADPHSPCAICGGGCHHTLEERHDAAARLR